MKCLNILLIMLPAVYAVSSCKKSDVDITPLASLNVTNAVIGGKNVKLNSNLTDSAVTMGYKAFGLIAGNRNVYLYPTGDSAHPYYNNSLAADNGSYYSLFLAGNTTASIDAVLVKETFSNYTDSIFGVRFINLSPNSNPVSINMFGKTNGSEVNSLTYKAISSFKAYSADYVNTTYKFEVRDASAGTLLTTYSFQPASPANPVPRFHNTTIVLKGLVGGSPAFGALLVNNY